MKPTRIVRFLQRPYFIYCSQAWQRGAALITLRIPITSPPITAENFRPSWMERKRILIFKLHGYPDRPDWYGMAKEGWKVTALTPDLVRSADLTGAIVIALVCHGAGGEMEQAFFDAGARAFVGSRMEVRARETEPGEADVLAKHLLRILAKGQQNLHEALARAKESYQREVVTLSAHDLFTLDTFELTERENHVKRHQSL